MTTLLHRPWTLLTYMFAHYDMLHVLFNMLWLYWLGKLFLEYFNSKQLVALYVLGGFGGALVYVLGYAVLPVFAGKVDLLIGASGAVLALVTAMAVFAPDYRIGLLFLGQVSLKWLAIGVVVLMVLGGGDGQLGALFVNLFSQKRGSERSRKSQDAFPDTCHFVLKRRKIGHLIRQFQ